VKHLLWLCTIAVVGGAAFPASASDAPAAPPARPGEPSALTTWAVLASKKVEQSGLADLVAAALSRDASLRLVDRDRLREAARELAFDRLAASEGSGDRRTLGRTLQADALLMLGDETADGKDILRLIVSDTRCGARLRTDYLPLEPAKAEALAATVAARVLETRERFSGGIRQVLGVPAFVSRNLTHDYDRFQAGYANLLAGALMSLPGVAVIETAEAREIGREIALAGGPDINRAVPLFIEGEFEVAAPPAVKEPEVTLSLKITDGHATVHSPPPRTLRLPEVAAYLGSELPAEIARLAGGPAVKPLDADRQFAALAARAEEFARLGYWELSMGLREAALVVKDDAGQRKAVADFARLPDIQRRIPASATGDKNRQLYESLCRERLQLWRAALAQVEHLIRNRQVSSAEARNMAGQVLYSTRAVGSRGGLPAAEQDRQRFIRQMYPTALALAREAGYDSLNRWVGFFSACLTYRFDHEIAGQEELGLLLDIAEEAGSAVGALMMITEAHPPWLAPRSGTPPQAARCYREDYLEFVERLKQSRHVFVALAGRYADLCLRYYERLAAKAPVDDLLQEAEQLFADLDAIIPMSPHVPPLADRTRTLISWIRTSVGLPALTVAPKVHTNPDEGKPVWDAVRPFAPVATFAKVPLQVRTASGESCPFEGRKWPDIAGGSSTVTSLLACGNELDVLWASGVLLFMREKGAATEVFVGAGPWIDDVQWDGKSVWVATRHDGIWILGPDGRTLAKISAEHGLPPADAGLLLHPLEPGRGFAVGSFGENQRAWCAIVDLAGASPRVNVFHQATTLNLGSFTALEMKDPTVLAFKPLWIHEYQTSGGEGRVLLVGRLAPTALGVRRPLRIDLATLKVSLFEREFPPAGIGVYQSLFSRDGRILLVRHWSATLFEAPGRKFPDERTSKDIIRVGGQHLQGQALPYRGRLYLPGSPWARINPETMVAETVSLHAPGPDRPSLPPWDMIYAVSAHYGLVAWARTGVASPSLYQIEIEEPAKPPAPPAAKSLSE